MHKRFFTKRFLFSMLGLALASVLLATGKLSGENWVYALAVVIAGHHAEDIVKAYRSADKTTPDSVSTVTVDEGDGHISAQEKS
jgi:hypothetical protein